MKYNPHIHHRRSIRLKGYDYSKVGYYFLTICTQNSELYFVEYPEQKIIVGHEWENIPNRYSNLELDEFVIMPNHLHGIIIVEATISDFRTGTEVVQGEMVNTQNNVGATLAVAQNKIPVAQNKGIGAQNKRAGASPAPTIGDIVGSFKSLCTNKWLRYIYEKDMNVIGKIWQRNYYAHVIRNEKELNHIRQYIIDNPLKWAFDIENPQSENFNSEYDKYFRGIYENQ